MQKLSLKEINDNTVKISKKIKLLDVISWPKSVEAENFSKIVKGKKPIIKFKYRKRNFKKELLELQKIQSLLSEELPSHLFTKNSIESYIDQLDLIHSVGTPRFQQVSEKIYGVPSHCLFNSQYSHLETAKKILKTYHEFDHSYIQAGSLEYTAKEMKNYLKEKSKKILKEDTPRFRISDKLTAKASAGKSSVSIRKNAMFTKYDFEQLFTHEIMTHSLTGINGSYQNNLSILGVGTPRTTKTQEGLATFSEIITGSMDLRRLKRISLRVIALDMALQGADFYQLYEFFLDNEQSQIESYLSASRILRGGPAKGGIVFTKDGVYLEGLIRVHSFFRWAFKTKNLDLAYLLFCGRLDINDVFLLKDEFKKGEIQAPRYLPDWFWNMDLLAGKMAFSLVLNGIDLDDVNNHYSKKMLSIAS